jgi:hypothetical protein
MTKTIYCTVKQARPTERELKSWWKLHTAADRLDYRYHGSDITTVASELERTDLTKEQRIFMLRAWALLVDDSALCRLLGAYEVWSDNAQDKSLRHVAYSPELIDQIDAGGLAYVYEEAYEEARAELVEASKGGSLDQELLGVLRQYGWNVDRKNVAAVLGVIMNRLKAFDAVGRAMSRYMLDPEAWLIDTVNLVDSTRVPEHDEEDDHD